MPSVYTMDWYDPDDGHERPNVEFIFKKHVFTSVHFVNTWHEVQSCSCVIFRQILMHSSSFSLLVGVVGLVVSGSHCKSCISTVVLSSVLFKHCCSTFSTFNLPTFKRTCCFNPSERFLCCFTFPFAEGGFCKWWPTDPSSKCVCQPLPVVSHVCRSFNVAWDYSLSLSLSGRPDGITGLA